MYNESELDKLLTRDLSSIQLSKLRVNLDKKLSGLEFDEQVELMNGIDAAGIAKLRTQLSEIHSENFGKDPSKSIFDNSFSKNWSLIIILALFITVSCLVYLKNKTAVVTPEQIFAEYYEPFDYKESRRDVTEQSLFSVGLLYQQKRFVDIISVYESNLKDKQDMTSDLILAVGISYLEIGKPYEAIYLFNQVINNNDFNYIDKAQWYKSLALIKAEEYKEGVQQLQGIVQDPSSSFASEGKEIITKIKSYLNSID